MEKNLSMQVLLNGTLVGLLNLNRNEGCEFRLVASYRQAYPRPVLGQHFLDDLEKVHRTRTRVPSWFSNLLPEGPLRELVARQAGVLPSREFFLLRHLGQDLPGAVRIVGEDTSSADIKEGLEYQPLQEGELHRTWHFSLAGVQLKFSALRAERGLTIPVSGTGGDWIVKLPDSRHARVPENEHATMRWAESSGIRIPDIELVDIADISGLPAHTDILPERRALAIRRFDRPAPSHRIHIEDFAQVLGLYPEQKYDRYNHETLARVIFELAGNAGLDEFIRRLVFIVASGNGDAHLKNWSLMYPDGARAELSPAYDLVSTIQYLPGDRLALNLARSKQWADVRMESFVGIARKIGEDGQRMVERVEASVDAVLAAWQRSAADFGYPLEARRIVERHLQNVPLFAGARRANIA